MLADDPRLASLREHLVGTCLYGTNNVRYHLRQALTEGGQGWIYNGNYDEPDGFPIVVKLLRPDALDGDTKHRFLREAGILRQLGAQATPNPNLVRFYDHGAVRLTPPRAQPGEHVDLPFIVLEYVNGTTLREVIDQARLSGTGLGASRVRRLMRQVVRALTTVHGLGIIHRDLKPSNILVTSEQGVEVAKVTDFGLAKLVEVAAGVQRTKMLAGATLGYAPPEQFEAGNTRVSARTDVFALATIVFECLTQKPAFPSHPVESPMRLLERMLNGPRPSLARSSTLPAELAQQPTLLSALDAAIARATQAEPEHRHASVLEFWNEAEPLLSTASTTGNRPQPSFAQSPPPFAVGGLARTPAIASEPRRSAPSVEPAGTAAAKSSRWTFRALTRAGVTGAVRSGFIGEDSNIAVVVGENGLFQWEGREWTPLRFGARVDLSRVRGVSAFPPDGFMLYGDAGLVTVVGASGADNWVLPDQDLNLLGALTDGVGVLMVGERRSRPVGVVIDAPFGRTPTAKTVEGTTRLCGVARLRGGAVVACGDAGALARVDTATPAAIPWGRTGHLSSIAARPDGGAFIVGGGAHALALTAGFVANLEAVNTTRDLFHVSVGSDGSAWACGADARLVTRQDLAWVRIAIEPEPGTAFLAVRARQDRLLALGDNGVILEARRI